MKIEETVNQLVKKKEHNVEPIEFGLLDLVQTESYTLF
jgi:hypothetical protein